MRSYILIAILAAAFAAPSLDDFQLVQPQATLNTTAIVEFSQGFMNGFLGSEVKDLTACVNDTVDLTIAVIRDVKVFFNGTFTEKIEAITDLFWHTVEDVPDALKVCRDVKNKTTTVWSLIKGLFKDIQNVKKIIDNTINNLGSLSIYLTQAYIYFGKGNYGGAGEELGELTRIIVNYGKDTMTSYQPLLSL